MLTPQGEPDGTERTTVLALATENTELRLQLAEVQDQCIELAVDAGELHAVIEVLQRQLADAHAELEAWRGGKPHSPALSTA